MSKPRCEHEKRKNSNGSAFLHFRICFIARRGNPALPSFLPFRCPLAFSHTIHDILVAIEARLSSIDSFSYCHFCLLQFDTISLFATMARGRKGNKRGGDKKAASPYKEEQPEEVWDLLRVLPESDTTVCSGKGCQRKAVAVWSNNLEPVDVWNGCEECQMEEFGGWPQGIEIPTYLSSVASPDANDSEDTSSGDKTSVDNALSITSSDKTSDASAVASDDGFALASDDDDAAEGTKQELSDEAATANDTAETASDDVGTTPDKDTSDVDAMPDKDAALPVASTQASSSAQNRDDKADTEEAEDGGDDTEEAEDSEEGDANADGDEDEWEMIEVMSEESLAKEQVLCSSEDCENPACVVYRSSNKATGKWRGCWDCQDEHFGGWPEDFSTEVPLSCISLSHMRALAKHCSRKKNPEMPNYPYSDTQSSPVPPSGKTGNKSLVTPSPYPPANNKKSAHAMSLHQKWQKEAEKFGGPNARIVVQKPAAKKIILDFLLDEFRPMNITSIHQGLKCIVPSPVLSSCLHDMCALNVNPFDEDSDDEGDAPKSNKNSSSSANDPFVGTVSYKYGKGGDAKNLSSILYYADYTKQKNQGDPDPVESSAIATDLSMVENEVLAMETEHNRLAAETAKLLSEPTNEDAEQQLATEVPLVDELRAQVEEARKLKVNEKQRKSLTKASASMAAEWRKRKRLCTEFLIWIDEATEGTCNMKKILKGDGQFYCESDEMAIATAKAAEESKKKKALLGRCRNKKGKFNAGVSSDSSSSSSPLADSNFIGVTMNSQGLVERVYLEDS
jgi:hypothetical protein